MDGRSLSRIVKRQAIGKTAIVTDRTISGSAQAAKLVGCNVTNHRLGPRFGSDQAGQAERLGGG
ncbi:MAG: hypothetical protein L0G69_16035 [Brevibacterium sp.]|nr:hypothetical protein [Brevibacterium sp.]